LIFTGEQRPGEIKSAYLSGEGKYIHDNIINMIILDFYRVIE